MKLPIQLISTDFDGTLFAEFENPPVPRELQLVIERLQAGGAKWVINTGRDLSSLMETMGRARLSIKPDYIVVVEREIHVHNGHQYTALEDWNQRCAADQEALFTIVRRDIDRLVGWVDTHFQATVYEDPYSPFCLIAEDNEDANDIQAFLEEYCKLVPNLTVVRNDIYARFSHAAYNKGTALSEIARLSNIPVSQILAAGDHFNDLPMLSRDHAHFLVAPANAIDSVKEKVMGQQGYVSSQPYGHGVARGIEFHLEQAGFSF